MKMHTSEVSTLHNRSEQIDIHVIVYHLMIGVLIQY